MNASQPIGRRCVQCRAFLYRGHKSHFCNDCTCADRCRICLAALPEGDAGRICTECEKDLFNVSHRRPYLSSERCPTEELEDRIAVYSFRAAMRLPLFPFWSHCDG